MTDTKARPNSIPWPPIVYLAAGPSVYTTATIPQIARYLGAEVADIRRE